MTGPPFDPVILLLAAALAVLVLWQLAWLLVRFGLRAAYRLPGTIAGSRAWARIHPLRAAAARRFPRVYAHLSRRLDPHRFGGLPLTLMVLAAAYLAALFGGLVEELGEAEELARFDGRVDALVGPWRATFLVDLFAWITAFGDTATLTAATLVATGFLWAHRRRHLILPLWVTIVGSQATTYIGKFGFGRERPDFVTSATASTPSFPSGHTTGAVAVYGFLAYVIVRDLVNPRQRFEITFWTAILIALVAFSRIFLSVHHASDVAAGFLVGGFWLLVGFGIAEFLRQRARDARSPTRQ